MIRNRISRMSFARNFWSRHTASRKAIRWAWLPWVLASSLILSAANSVTFAPYQNYPVPGSGDQFALGPQSLELADMNGDGRLDVVVQSNSGLISIFLGNGDGTFITPTTSLRYSQKTGFDNPPSYGVAGGIAVGDFNKDGKQDVAACDLADGRLLICLGNGDGTLNLAYDYTSGSTASARPTSIVAADFEHTGNLGLVLINWSESTLQRFRGTGTGAFNRIGAGTDVGRAILAPNARDLNGDGWADLVFVRDSSIGVLLNDQEGGFSGLSVGGVMSSPSGIVAVRSAGGGYRYVLSGSNGTGGFSNHYIYTVDDVLAGNLAVGSARVGFRSGFPQGLAAADLNGDGNEDVVISTQSHYVAVLLNRGDGNYTSPVGVSAGPESSTATFGVCIGDLNGDGRPDVVAVNNTGSLRVLLQVPPIQFTSSGSTVFGAEADNTFQVTATGVPAPTFTLRGTLPPNVTFSSAGILSGRPPLTALGTYPLELVASNGVALSVTQSFSLVVGDLRPTVTHLPPANIRPTTISLGGYLPDLGGAPLTRRGFVWARTADNAYPTLGGGGVRFVDVPVDTLRGFTAGIVGLSPATDYSYAAFAENAFGINYAPVSTFQTLAPPGAGSLVVTTASDEDNGNSDPNNGAGTSLREAVNYANLLGADATITFSPNLFFSGPATLQVTLGQITLNNVGGTTTVTGPGANLITLNGAANGMQRILRTVTGATVINGITFANALSSDDGSAMLAGGTVVLNDCVFLNNASPLSRGGAVSVSGETRLYRCTFQGNSAGYGGAIVVEGNLLLVQCTLHGNSADRGDGGALYSPFTANLIRVVHSTFSGNSAVGTGGAISFSGDRLRVFNSILSGNTAPASPNLQGSLQDNVNNLIDADPANIFATGLPANHGGSTPTITLKPGGLAINAGSNAQAVNWTSVFNQTSDPLTTDQRGLPRNIGGTVDIGATELPGLPAVSAPTVSRLTASSVILGGNVTSDGFGPIRLRGIVYSRTADNPNPTLGGPSVIEVAVAGTLGNFTAFVETLSPLTGYSFAAFAVNEAGAVYSPVAAFDTGSVDSDGDTLTDNQESTFNSNPYAIDTDSDGFNDATEFLAGSNPASAASTPPTTHVERVLGFGPARGLDLTGNFLYAFNAGPAGAAGQAGDVDFTADTAPGITVGTPNNPISVWNNPDFGSLAGDDVLEKVYQSIRWADHLASDPEARKLRVDLAGLTVGGRYKLQLLFGEAGASGRRFDVYVNGALVVDDFDPTTAQGSPFCTTAGSAIVYEFTATSAVLQIVLAGSNVASVPNLNTDPYLNGATLEVLSTPRCVQGDIVTTWGITNNPTTGNTTLNIGLYNPHGLSSVVGLIPKNITMAAKAYDAADALLLDLGTLSEGATVALPPGTVRVVVEGTRGDPTKRASFDAQAFDLCGLYSGRVDPVITKVQIEENETMTRQVLTDIPSFEHYVSVQNGRPGLRTLRLIVNGHRHTLSGLADTEVAFIDIGPAMEPGTENTVVVEGEGEVGASAVVTIGDTPVGGGSGPVQILMPGPTLHVERTADGLELSWFVDGTHFELQNRSGLGTGNEWTRWPESPEKSGDRWIVRVPESASEAQLFRLRSE